jgi:hypothetical protein
MNYQVGYCARSGWLAYAAGAAGSFCMPMIPEKVAWIMVGAYYALEDVVLGRRRMGRRDFVEAW